MTVKIWCPQHGYPLPCDKCGLGLFEAGRKEGIDEVVKWVEKHCKGYHIGNRGGQYGHFAWYKSEWQSFLKSLGIE